MVHTCNTSTQEVETGGLIVRGLPGATQKEPISKTVIIIIIIIINIFMYMFFKLLLHSLLVF
jgi:hypothetical protein